VRDYVERGTHGAVLPAEPVHKDDVAVLGDRRVGQELLEDVPRESQNAADGDRE
jgi:hypothetical protein